MDVGSAAAIYAGSVLVKKTFEVVAQRSLSSLFTRLNVRFRGQIEAQLQVLEKELESRLQVLSLPVDMCVQYVLHGNTALQGALDMALRVINDIVSFQEELEAQAYNESIVKTSQADAVARLQSFMTRLDSILPYLSMAVNAVSLLRVADSGLSPSRLMESSHLIRTANGRQGTVTTLRAKLYKYETKLTLPRWQEKMRCCVSLKQAFTMPGNEFELSITNDEESESGDLPTCIRLPVTDISAVGLLLSSLVSELCDQVLVLSKFSPPLSPQDKFKPNLCALKRFLIVLTEIVLFPLQLQRRSSTLHVLGLGQHELEAVLLVDTLVYPGSTAVAAKDGSAGNSLKEVNHYAFQVIEDDNDAENELNQQDDPSDHDGGSSYGSQEGDAQELESSFGSKVYKLGMLEYALRLCMLQVKEEKEHWLLSDERIRLFFVDPRYISEPMGTIQKTRAGSGKISSGFQTPTPRKGDPVRSLSSRTSAGTVKVASRIPSLRSNISELFYELRLDSPGGPGTS